MSSKIMESVPKNNELHSFLTMLQNRTDDASRIRNMQMDIPVTATGPDGHSSMILSHWDKLTKLIHTIGTAVDLDGKSLDLATVVAIARYSQHGKECYKQLL